MKTQRTRLVPNFFVLKNLKDSKDTKFKFREQ